MERSPGDAARRRVRAELERALPLMANDLLGRSQRVVPLEEGTLAGSGHVEPARGVDWGGDRAEVRVVYDTPYAEVQHERLDFVHREGRQAKYLEDPLKDMASRYREALGEAMRRGMRG